MIVFRASCENDVAEIRDASQSGSEGRCHHAHIEAIQTTRLTCFRRACETSGWMGSPMTALFLAGIVF